MIPLGEQPHVLGADDFRVKVALQPRSARSLQVLVRWNCRRGIDGVAVVLGHQSELHFETELDLARIGGADDLACARAGEIRDRQKVMDRVEQIERLQPKLHRHPSEMDSAIRAQIDVVEAVAPK